MPFFSSRSRNEKKTMLAAAIGMAVADGHMDESEAKICTLIAARLGLSPADVKEIISNRGSVKATAPSTREERILNLIELTAVAAADGEITDDELAVLMKMAIAYGISGAELARIHNMMADETPIDDIIASIG